MKKIVALILTLLLFSTAYAEVRVVNDLEWRDDNVAYAVGEDKRFSGIYSTEFSNGKPSLIINFTNGRRDGLYTQWYDNNHKQSQVNYANGIQDGLELAWYYNGQKELEANWIKGKRDREVQWDRAGNMVFETDTYFIDTSVTKKGNTTYINNIDVGVVLETLLIIILLTIILPPKSIIFSIMGLISGFILLVLPWNIFEYSIYLFRAGKSNAWWLVGLPGVVFGAVLYATLRYHRIIVGNHWKNLLILIIASIAGWVIANEVYFTTKEAKIFTEEIALGLSGALNALLIAIALLWACKLDRHRLLFVSIIGVFGLISSGVVIYIIEDIHWVLQVWHPIVFIGIAVSLFLVELKENKK